MKDLSDKRIFLGLVNYGTQSGLIANGLRELGLNATSITYPDRFKRATDIELLHGGNLIQRVVRHSLNWICRFSWIFRFDYFHFFYGTSLLPYQIDLPILRLLGKKIILHYLGNDVQLYKLSTQKYKWTNMTGLIDINDSKQYDAAITKRLNFESKFCDAQIVCAPMYSEFVVGSTLLPLGLNLKHFERSDLLKTEQFVIAHAPTHKGFKGTEFIQAAIFKLREDGFNFEFRQIENVSHDDLKLEYRRCHIFIDQLLAGWYGTAAIEAMATGRPVVCFIRESYISSLPENLEIPIINANPDNLYVVLQSLISLHLDELQLIGNRSRKYVEEIHDIRKVCSDLKSMYSKL